MTIPFNVPPVQPIWFQPGKSDAEVVAGGVHNIGAGIAGMLQQQQERAQQAQIGEMLKALVLGVDKEPLNVPGLNLPGGAQTAPVSTTIPGQLANAVRGKPGEIVYGALGKAQPLLQGAMSRNQEMLSHANDMELERLKQSGDLAKVNATAKDPKDAKFEIKDMNGFWRAVDPAHPNTAFLILDEKGLPLASNMPAPAKEDLDEYFDTRTNQYVRVPRRAGALPPYLTKSGVITEPERRDAKLYNRAAIAYRSARKEAPLPQDFVQQLLAAESAGQGTSKITEWLGRTKLPQATRRAVLAWNQVLTSGIYGYSGAAVTIGEFLRELAKVPTTADDPETLKTKYELIEGDLGSLEIGGGRELDNQRLSGNKNLPPKLTELLAQIYGPTPEVTPEERKAIGLP